MDIYTFGGAGGESAARTLINDFSPRGLRAKLRAFDAWNRYRGQSQEDRGSGGRKTVGLRACWNGGHPPEGGPRLPLHATVRLVCECDGFMASRERARIRREREQHTGFDMNTQREHILLTVLGVNPRTVEYSFERKSAKASLAPLALLELLPESKRPDRVVAICTPRARQESLPLLEENLAGRYQLTRVDVSGDSTNKEIRSYLLAVSFCDSQER